MRLACALCLALMSAPAFAAEGPREMPAQPAVHVPQTMTFMVSNLMACPPELRAVHLSELAGIGQKPLPSLDAAGRAYWAAQSQGRLATAAAVAQAMLATPEDFAKMRQQWHLPSGVMDGLAALREPPSDNEHGRASLASIRQQVTGVLAQIHGDLEGKLPFSAEEWNRFFDASAVHPRGASAVDAAQGGDPRVGAAARAAARLGPSDELLARRIMDAASKEDQRLQEDRTRELQERQTREGAERLKKLEPGTQAVFDAVLAGKGVPPAAIKGRKLLGSSDPSRATGYKQEWLAWTDGKVYRALIEVNGPKAEPNVVIWQEADAPAGELSAPAALQALADARDAERAAGEREKAEAERLHRERQEKAGAAHVARWLAERGIAPEAVRGRALVRSFELAGEAKFDESFDYDQQWVVWTADKGYRLRVTKDRTAAVDRGASAPRFQRDSFIEVDVPAGVADVPSYVLQKAARRDPALVRERWAEDHQAWAREQALRHLEEALAEYGVPPAAIRGKRLVKDLGPAVERDNVFSYRQVWAVWTGDKGYRVSISGGEALDPLYRVVGSKDKKEERLEVAGGEPVSFKRRSVVEVPLADALAAR